jgi:hypothetical protein
MTIRENTLNLLHYQPYQSLPIVHFGYWRETLAQWANEGLVPDEPYSNELVDAVGCQQGFDMEWRPAAHSGAELNPSFKSEVVEVLPDGSRKLRNRDGVIVLDKNEAGSIPAEIEHLLVDRATWEEHYKHRLQFSEDRIDRDALARIPGPEERELPVGLMCGSLFGRIRDILGVTGTSYVYMDDEDLYDELIEAWGSLVYQCTEATLASGVRFDFAHLWEDICFKNGPLVIPSVFEEKVGPQYKRLTDLLHRHGVEIVSLDCDGCIDALIPTWLGNGVNTMFPIEVGTWHASIAPWREQYGRDLRGIGGMDKRVFGLDRAAIDAEIERLKPLIDLGGYIPCPDHRIPPDALYDNVCYYTERMRAEFT